MNILTPFVLKIVDYFLKENSIVLSLHAAVRTNKEAGFFQESIPAGKPSPAKESLRLQRGFLGWTELVLYWIRPQSTNIYKYICESLHMKILLL